MKKGKVYFVGAGPGTIDLLSTKGKRCIELAEVVIYDRLVDESILSLCKEDAEMIYVGKEATTGGETQKEINRIITEKYLEKKVVVRLKGGDSFVFGRGGEEIEELLKYGDDFQLIPGITSAIAVPEYAGIPVTHRGVSNSFHVFTGHLSEESKELDYSVISQLEGTLVFLMGVKNLDKISSNLIQNGKSKNTPVGIIESGCRDNQRVTIGTLENIYNLSKEKGVKSPAITIIGDVVNLREKFNWFERMKEENVEKNKEEKTSILVTRDSENSPELLRDIEDNGYLGIDLPFIKIEKNQYKKVNLADYKVILFNSPNGVKFFLDDILDFRILRDIKIGVVGEKTEEELRKYHLVPDFRPSIYTIEELVKNANDFTSVNDKILVVTSDISPFNGKKWQMENSRIYDKIVAYKTKILTYPKDRVEKALEKTNYITFLSSSAVVGFIESIEGDISLVKDKKIVSIGSVTSKKIREYGMSVYLEASDFTGKGVLDAIKGDRDV